MAVAITASDEIDTLCPWTGKVAWPSKAKAQRSLFRMRRRGDLAQRVYRCGACDGWHVTSQRRR